MKFGIDKGHNVPTDTGATGVVQEDKVTKEVGDELMTYLKSLGHTVVDCTPTAAQAPTLRKSLSHRTDTANAANVDRFVSIHFNAADKHANGCEVFCIPSSPVGKKMADKSLEALVGLGFKKRSVKDGSHLYVVTHTDMPAILVEVCFCDSATDISHYNALGAKAIAKALGDAVVV